MMSTDQRSSSRGATLDALVRRRRSGELIVAAGVGSGLTAAAAARGGADLVVAYHSAPLRLSGWPAATGMLPVADANELARRVTDEVLLATPTTPVLTSVFGSDPTRNLNRWLDDLASRGVTGIINAPSVGIVDGAFRAELERAGLGYGRDVELIAAARARDLLTCAYCFTPEQTRAMADAGADVLIPHLGVTSDHPDAGNTFAAAGLLQQFLDALRDQPVPLILAHGGPLVGPDDLRGLLACGVAVDGFFGVSSFERVPVSEAVERATRQFRDLADCR